MLGGDGYDTVAMRSRIELWINNSSPIKNDIVVRVRNVVMAQFENASKSLFEKRVRGKFESCLLVNNFSIRKRV